MEQARDAVVRRRLERYIALVEDWGLCPWAAGARDAIHVATVWGGDDLPARVGATIDPWPPARIAFVIVPDIGPDPVTLRRLRDRVAAAHPGLAFADFHPRGGDAARALETPARLVPILRRSPDSMLQVVPQADLAALAPSAPMIDPAAQAALLAGKDAPPIGDVRARLAAANLDVVRGRGLDRLLAELDAIAACR